MTVVGPVTDWGRGLFLQKPVRGQVKFRNLNLPDVENFPDLQSFSVPEENFYIGCQISVLEKLVKIVLTKSSVVQLKMFLFCNTFTYLGGS